MDSGGASIACGDSGHDEPALLLMPAWCALRTVFADIEGPLAGEIERFASGCGAAERPAA